MTQKTKSPAAQKAAPQRTKRAVKTPQKKVEAATKPKVNPHVEAGLDVNRYAGPSKFVNGNRRVKVLLGVSRNNLTDRAAQGLYALRDCYGSKSWTPKGFDNGILRDLLAMGLIESKAGTQTTIDGASYLIDGAEPAQFKVTSAGMAYGKA